MPKPQHNHTHPKREELLDVFGVTWEWANLQQRKYVKTKLDHIESRMDDWVTHLNQCRPQDEWFIHDRLSVLIKYQEKYDKRLYFLKKATNPKKSVDHSDSPKFIEYDKEQIRQIPIARILGEHGHHPIKPSTSGEFYRCLFHNEKTPSMHVNTEGNYYYCFGCGAKGDVIKLYQHLTGADFIGALRDLNNYI